MTTTVLRPDSTPTDLVTNTTTTTGAATPHAATSDNLDTSYVGVGVGEGVEIGFTTKTFGAGEITKSLTFRVRHGTNTFSVRVRDPSNLIVTIPLGRSGPIEDTTVSTIAYAGTSTNVDALRTWVTGPSAGSDTRIYELYLDLVTVPLPVTVVDAVTPDPYTASTNIPISWANTLNADGGAQTHYEIRTFTDAQYGAGGFDAATSEAYHETGVVVSSATSTTVGPLENSDTYRSYVRVAQTVNGVKHWSAYANDEYTLSVTTSDISTVVATAVDASGKIGVVVTRNGASAAWEYVEVERSIDASVTWTAVRGATFVDTTGHATLFDVDDYEVANGQAAVYRARATYYSSGLPITGAWVSATSESWSSTTDQWLKNPADPTLNVTIKGYNFGTATRDARAGVFTVIGSSATIVVADQLTSPIGSLSIRVEGQAATLAVDALFESSSVFVLNLLPDSLIGPARDGFMYISVLSTGENWQHQYYRGSDIDRREITLPFVRIASPPDPLASSA